MKDSVRVVRKRKIILKANNISIFVDNLNLVLILLLSIAQFELSSPLEAIEAIKP